MVATYEITRRVLGRDTILILAAVSQKKAPARVRIRL
jgi:hypothetical protein